MMRYHRTTRRPTQADFPRSPFPLGIGTINRKIRSHLDLDAAATGTGWLVGGCESDMLEHPKRV